MDKSKGKTVKSVLIDNNTYIVLLVLIIICALLSDKFLTVMNIRNIALQQAAPICAAIGMLFVVLTGGIDLSVGAVMAFSASLSAILIAEHGMSLSAAVFIGLLTGVLYGLLNGILVAYAGMQGFVATLAVQTIARGASYVLTNGMPIKAPEGTLDTFVKSDYFFPIIIITVVLVLLFVFIQKNTTYGRLVMAVGSNAAAVDLAGIPSRHYIASTYVLSGLLAALAGIFLAARTSTGTASIGLAQETDAIAACVIGGASLAGGRGFVLRTVAGALVLALVRNIMNLMAVPSYPQDIIRGIIIILAVLMQIVTGRSRRSRKKE